MKKVIYIFLLSFITFFSYSQNPKDTIRVVLTADSHGESTPPGGNDSLWINILKTELQNYYSTVILTNLSIGGTQIQNVMPTGYPGSNSNLNINKILTYNPDLVIIAQSGNHTVFGVPADTSIYCFKYLIDTLNSLGKKFIITGQAPRQKTFVNPITLQSYYDSSKKINSFFQSYIPNNWVDPYPTMEDTIFGKRPWPNVLRSDSLHFSDYGERLYYKIHSNSIIFDSICSDYKGQAINFSFVKVGDSLRLRGDFKYRKIYIYGSNTYTSNYVLLQTYVSNSAILTNEQKTMLDLGYTWYKIVIYSGRRTLTKTIKIN